MIARIIPILFAVIFAVPAQAQTGRQQPAAKPPAQPAAAPAPQGDAAFGAFQRGFYVTALVEASRRMEEKNDPKAITLLGELYANGLGVGQSDAKAAEFYKRAADRGDREAMLQLGIMRFQGRGGKSDSVEAARLFTASAKLGSPTAAYNLALLYLEGQAFPQDFTRAAELLRAAAGAGSPEAQYALATLYKEGRGVEKNLPEAARWFGLATLGGHVDAEVEYAIYLFNGIGSLPKDENRAAQLFARAARRGNPIAQNRIAHILFAGRGLPADPVQAAKWHLAAKAAGNSDPKLDQQVAALTPDQRATAEKAARPWLALRKPAN